MRREPSRKCPVCRAGLSCETIGDSLDGAGADAARAFLATLRAQGDASHVFGGVLAVVCLWLDERVLAKADMDAAADALEALASTMETRRRALDLEAGTSTGPLRPDAAKLPRVIARLVLGFGVKVMRRG